MVFVVHLDLDIFPQLIVFKTTVCNQYLEGTLQQTKTHMSYEKARECMLSVSNESRSSNTNKDKDTQMAASQNAGHAPTDHHHLNNIILLTGA